MKVKCRKRQEFVIGGWTDPNRAGESLGHLLVSYCTEPSELVYCGRVGTGFTQQSLHNLHQALQALEQTQSPFRNPPSGSEAQRGDPLDQAQAGGRGGVCRLDSGWNVTSCFLSQMVRTRSLEEITLELPVVQPSGGTHNRPDDPKSRRQTMAPPLSARSEARQEKADVLAGVRLTRPESGAIPRREDYKAQTHSLLHIRCLVHSTPHRGSSFVPGAVPSFDPRNLVSIRSTWESRDP